MVVREQDVPTGCGNRLELPLRVQRNGRTGPVGVTTTTDSDPTRTAIDPGPALTARTTLPRPARCSSWQA